MSFRLFALFALFLLLAVAVALALPPSAALSLADASRGFASMHSKVTALLLGGVYALSFAFTVPIAAVLAIVLGFLYGFWTGLVVSVIASLVGALAMFLAARKGYFLRCAPLIGGSHERLLEEARRHPVSFLLFTRFAPFVPFPVAHLIPAEAGVKTSDFAWTTLAGALPASAVFVALGASAHHLAAGEPLPVVPALVGLAALSVLVFVGLVVRRVERRNLKQSSDTRPQASLFQADAPP